MKDGKEYGAAIELVQISGRKDIIANKFIKLATDAADPVVRRHAQDIGDFIHSVGEWNQHAHHFRVADSLGWGAKSYEQALYMDSVRALVKHCEGSIAAQIPQWQILALRAGWVPPSPAPSGAP